MGRFLTSRSSGRSFSELGCSSWDSWKCPSDSSYEDSGVLNPDPWSNQPKSKQGGRGGKQGGKDGASWRGQSPKRWGKGRGSW